MKARPLALAVLLATPASLVPAWAAAQQMPAQQGSSFELTIANVMRGPEVYGREPQQVRWSPDSRWIYFRWNEPGTNWREPPRPYRVRATGGAPERVPDAQLDSVGPLLAEGAESLDRRLRAVSHDGDLWLIPLRSGNPRRLTETLARETSPRFSADARRVFFLRDNNVFSIELDGGLVRQLTDIRAGPEPKDSTPPGGQRGRLAEDQRMLLEAVRDRLRADSIARAERLEREGRRMKPLYLNQGERVQSLSVSPNGQGLLITTFSHAPKSRTAQVPTFVTSSGYTEELSTRTKVGDDQGSGRIAYMRLPSGDARWLRPIPGDTTRAPSTVLVVDWNEAGTQALVWAEGRDYKQRVLSAVAAEDGAVRQLYSLRDTAWVGGPCFGCAGYYDSGRRIWFVSEADGWAHLYTMAADGSDRRQLTRGEFEVLGVELSADRTQFRLHTSRESVFDRDFYTMPVRGGEMTRITRGKGSHSVEVSPDGRLLANVHSTANRPPELFVMANRPGAPMTQLTTSPTAEFLSYPWLEPEILYVPASDGVQVPARIYRPQDVGAQPNGAGVIFVHGAGYLHNVHNWWSVYAREFMFHHILVRQGYVVLDIDYRGSAGYGRDWRTAIYRHMGGRDLQDHVDGSRYLGQQFGIPPERVGIYGGSYGGFITLMALFNEPQWFGAGAALRSVTDWAHYNHPYTARILNTPDDTTAYRRSSPIYFAEGLSDPLLMAHGMVDVNVHYQDIVRLTQRLIELGKTDWELASYPVEDHAFVRPSSWTDEYRRIFELFERHIGGATR